MLWLGLQVLCLIKSGKSRGPYLLSDLRGNAFKLLTIEKDDSYGLLLYGLYYAEVCSLYTHFGEVF